MVKRREMPQFDGAEKRGETEIKMKEGPGGSGGGKGLLCETVRGRQRREGRVSMTVKDPRERFRMRGEGRAVRRWEG